MYCFKSLNIEFVLSNQAEKENMHNKIKVDFIKIQVNPFNYAAYAMHSNLKP